MAQNKSVSPDDPAKRPYTQAFVRHPDSVPTRWRLEARDLAMLEAIYQHEGMLTNCQLEALFFAPSQPTDNPRSAKRSAETRLQYLYHRGFVDRLPLSGLGPGRSAIVNILDHVGVNEITMRLGLDRARVYWRPKIVKNKPSSHLHSILVNDVRVAFERAVQTANLILTTWMGERLLKSKAMQGKLPFLATGFTKSAVKAPDSAFFLKYPAEEYVEGQVKPVGFFVEVDRGTENNTVWAEKVRAFEEFRSSGLAEQYYGVTNFRILVTAATSKRLENLVKTTIKAGGGPFYWFTLQENADIFQPWRVLAEIWTVAGWEGRYSLKSLKKGDNRHEK